MVHRFEDKMPSKNDPEGGTRENTSRRSVLTGLSLMTLSGVGGLFGFSKCGIDESIEPSATAGLRLREGPEYDMTETLPLDAVQAQRLAELGTIVVAKKSDLLSEIVEFTYADQVKSCNRPFTGEVHRELTDLVARLNLYRTDALIEEGGIVLLPPLNTFVAPLNRYQELALPSSAVWISRVSDELSEYAYLIARPHGVVVPTASGCSHVAETGTEWDPLIKAYYPELDSYPKTRRHLTSVIAGAHGASIEHGPEEGRIIFLPKLEILLRGSSDPASLLKVSPTALARRFPPNLTHAISLERDVWNKFISPEQTSRAASIPEEASKPSATSRTDLGLQDRSLPSLPAGVRTEFRPPKDLEVSAGGLSLIKAYESFCAKPYYCCAKKLTVGYGCRRPEALQLARSQTEGLTKADAHRFLKKDVGVHQALVQKHFSDIFLTQGMFDAIVSWSFNTGALETFDSYPKKQPTLHKLLEAGDYKNGLKELLKWVYYTKNGQKCIAKGLARRRASEYQLAIKGFKETEAPQRKSTL